MVVYDLDKKKLYTADFEPSIREKSDDEHIAIVINKDIANKKHAASTFKKLLRKIG